MAYPIGSAAHVQPHCPHDWEQVPHEAIEFEEFITRHWPDIEIQKVPSEWNCCLLRYRDRDIKPFGTFIRQAHSSTWWMASIKPAVCLLCEDSTEIIERTERHIANEIDRIDKEKEEQSRRAAKARRIWRKIYA